MSFSAFFLCLNACVDPQENFSQFDQMNSQALSSYTLWQAYEGSASARGLPYSTILHIANKAQNLFATGHIGQKMTWAINNDHGEIAIIDIIPRDSVPCLQYGQKIITKHEIRRSQGIACLNQFNIWQIVEENLIDPLPHMF